MRSPNISVGASVVVLVLVAIFLWPYIADRPGIEPPESQATAVAKREQKPGPRRPTLVDDTYHREGTEVTVRQTQQTPVKYVKGEAAATVPSSPVPPPRSPPPVVTSAANGTPSSRTAVDANHGATISGTVLFDGDPPKRKVIKVDIDPVCAAINAQEPLLSEELVVNEDGALRNVFVYVKSGLEGRTFIPPKTPVILDLLGCQYYPHVFGVMTRQRLAIVNNDPTLHNVHARGVKNPEFNIGQPRQGMISYRMFTTAEVMISITSDVHPWMRAYCGVLDHPFFSVAGEDGQFVIEGLPPGEYEVETWHEKLGTQQFTATLETGKSVEVVVTYHEPER